MQYLRTIILLGSGSKSHLNNGLLLSPVAAFPREFGCVKLIRLMLSSIIQGGLILTCTHSKQCCVTLAT